MGKLRRALKKPPSLQTQAAQVHTGIPLVATQLLHACMHAHAFLGALSALQHNCCAGVVCKENKTELCGS